MTSVATRMAKLQTISIDFGNPGMCRSQIAPCLQLPLVSTFEGNLAYQFSIDDRMDPNMEMSWHSSDIKNVSIYGHFFSMHHCLNRGSYFSVFLERFRSIQYLEYVVTMVPS